MTQPEQFLALRQEVADLKAKLSAQAKPSSQFFPTESEKAFNELVTSTNRKLDLLLKGQTAMALDFTKMQASLAAITTADAGILSLVTTMAAEIKTMAGNLQNPADQATLNDFADKLLAQAQPLTDAVLANTPTPIPPAAPAAKKP